MAALGTPADAGEASANAGQVITLSGADGSFTTSVDLVVRYSDTSGNPQAVRLNPTSVNAEGSEAIVQLPAYVNDAYGLQVVGAANQPLLQIVPTVSRIDVDTTNRLRFYGSGFVEGDDSVYDLGGTTTTDTEGPGGVIDVFTGNNDSVLLQPPPAFGSGAVTVTTSGGTSPAFDPGLVFPAQSTLYAVERDGSGGYFVIAGSRVRHIGGDGSLIRTFDNPSVGHGGLELLTAPLDLRDTPTSTVVTLPAGTLLVFKNNDVIDALDVNTGAILASFDPGPNFGTVGGVYNPVSETLFYLDWSPDEIIEIDPATGGEIQRYASPVAVNDGGLAVDPVSGNLYAAGTSNNNLVEFERDGTVVRTIDLSAQDIANEISGLDYVDSSTILASSTRGFIYELSLSAPVIADPPVLTALDTTSLNGTPTNPAVASANVAQLIEIVGTDLTRSTPVVFPTRDIEGNVGTMTVTPSAVNADGTRAQVIVPDLATSGAVTLGGGGSGSVDLQVVPLIFFISGRPANDGTFDLVGSGFMEGASTITVGGTVFEDVHRNLLTDNVTGSRNDRFRLTLPLAVEGSITIQTSGGTFTHPGAGYAVPSFVELSDVMTGPLGGVAANTSEAATHAGELITLVGRGFTNSTLVQFDGVDGAGGAGIITRTGSMTAGGTRLTVIVPIGAVSGSVRVVGDETEVPLQIVPRIASVGGNVTPGEMLLIEGTGLVQGDLVVTIDGQVTGAADVRPINDRNHQNAAYFSQQVAVVTVPAGVSNGVVEVSTAGGTFTYDSGVSVASLADVTATGDIGDTLDLSLAIDLPSDATRTIRSVQVGDGAFGARDVDMFSFVGNSGDLVDITALRFAGAGNLYARLFDADGNELVGNGFNGPGSSPRLPASGSFSLPVSGTYYVGVSGWANTAYDPTVAGSGIDGGQGSYILSLQRIGGGSTTLASIDSVAGSGVPSIGTIASAVTGQTITINGSGFVTGDQVHFTASDTEGRLYQRTVTPTSIAGDGMSMEVVVPGDAVSGRVRLTSETTGLFLQIVPTLVDIDQGANDSFENGGMRLTGSGFSEGAMSISFGDRTLVDPSRTSSEMDTFSTNTATNIRVPRDVPSGPITVSTLGGTSAPFGLTFTAIDSVSGSGTAADGGEASANPGQSITLEGTNFDSTTDVVFLVSNTSGQIFERIVRPVAFAPDGTSLEVVVPTDAITGPLRVVGDQNATEALLQVVPTVSFVDLTSVNITTANFTVSGTGLIEGDGTLYSFGSSELLDPDTGSNLADSYSSNTRSNVRFSYSEDLFGSITVTTQGGTSAAYSIDLSGIDTVAALGTPADAGEASANAGQVITLSGADGSFTTSVDLVVRYSDTSGNPQAVRLNPTSVNAEGSEAIVQLPAYVNDAYGLQVVGAANQPLLQIVPTVSRIDVDTTNRLRFYGSGFVEGDDSVYDLGGTTTTDTEGPGGVIDVFTGNNDSVLLQPPPAFGSGAVTVTTSGGTSPAFDPGLVFPAQSTLYAVERDGSGGYFVIAGSRVRHIGGDGSLIRTFDNPSVGHGGLELLTAPLDLRDTPTSTVVTLPAGTLLVFKNNDVIDALDVNTGAILASFDPGPNFGTVGGVYNPVSETLFYLDWSPDEIIEIDPATGGEIQRYASPVAVNDGGLAVDPVSGNLYAAGTSNNNLVEFERDGTVVRTIDLSAQDIANEISGLDYVDSSTILASSTRGFIYELALPAAVGEGFSVAAATPAISVVSTSPNSANLPVPLVPSASTFQQSIDLNAYTVEESVEFHDLAIEQKTVGFVLSEVDEALAAQQVKDEVELDDEFDAEYESLLETGADWNEGVDEYFGFGEDT